MFPEYNEEASCAEPNHFYAAPASGKTFDPASAFVLLYIKLTFLKQKKRFGLWFFRFFMIKNVVNVIWI
jgi:hypothetical protein